MFLDRTKEARKIYLKYKGKTVVGKPWEQVMRDDFAALRKHGLDHPLMKEVEKVLGSVGK